MSTGQSTVAINMAAGVPGEIYLDGPWRAQPGVIDSDGVTNPNRVARVFTQTAGVNHHCGVGGSGVFFGILANPKVYPLFTGSLTPSLDLPQYSNAEFVYDTTGIWISLPAACNVGDAAFYNTTTGVITTQAKTGNVAGPGTVATASNVATVASLAAGSPIIGVGSVLTLATGLITTVTAVLTGTGGNGTYTVSTTPDHAAQAFTYTAATPTGTARIPGFEVVRFNLTAAGLGVIGNIN